MVSRNWPTYGLLLGRSNEANRLKLTDVEDFTLPIEQEVWCMLASIILILVATSYIVRQHLFPRRLRLCHKQDSFLEADVSEAADPKGGVRSWWVVKEKDDK